MKASPVIICVEDSEVSSWLANLLANEGITSNAIQSVQGVLQRDYSSLDIIFLQTRTDVALLVRTVYELTFGRDANQKPMVIVLASGDQIQLNPSLCGWEIDGRAALAALFTLGSPELPRSIPLYVRRLIAGGHMR